MLNISVNRGKKMESVQNCLLKGNIGTRKKMGIITRDFQDKIRIRLTLTLILA